MEGAQNRLGAFFFILAFTGFWSITTIDILHYEKSIVLKEVSLGYYSQFQYIFSKHLLDSLLLRALPSVLTSIPFYFLMGLNLNITKFFIYFFTIITFNLTIGSLTTTLTLVSSTPDLASLLIVTILLLNLLYTGQLVNLKSMTNVVNWFKYMSPYYYASQCLIVNELEDTRLSMEVNNGVIYVNGNSFLERLGMGIEDFSENLVVLVGMWLGSVLTVFVALKLTKILDAVLFKRN